MDCNHKGQLTPTSQPALERQPTPNKRQLFLGGQKLKLCGGTADQQPMNSSYSGKQKGEALQVGNLQET